MERENDGDADELLRRRGCWGVFDASVGRYGVHSSRLVVLPADVTLRAWVVWRFRCIWIGVGFVVGVLAGVTALVWVPPSLAVSLGAILWVGPVLWASTVVRSTTARARALWTTIWSEEPEAPDQAALLAHRLQDASRAYRSGEIDAATFRARWAAVYDALPVTVIARPAAQPAR